MRTAQGIDEEVILGDVEGGVVGGLEVGGGVGSSGRQTSSSSTWDFNCELLCVEVGEIFLRENILKNLAGQFWILGLPARYWLKRESGRYKPEEEKIFLACLEGCPPGRGV